MDATYVNVGGSAEDIHDGVGYIFWCQVRPSVVVIVGATRPLDYLGFHDSRTDALEEMEQ